MYYYGARYYNPRESVWLSVDPLAEKYPNVFPYAYTFQNPIKYIDPTGMEGESVDDIIKVYKNGNIEITKTDDDFDTIVNEDGTQSRTIAKNSDGSSQIRNLRTLEYNLSDSEGNSTDKLTTFVIDNNDTAKDVFKFIHRVVDVEFAQDRYEFDDGFSTNLIITAHLPSAVPRPGNTLTGLNLGVGDGIYRSPSNATTWVFNLHSHPISASDPAYWYPSGMQVRSDGTIDITPFLGDVSLFYRDIR